VRQSGVTTGYIVKPLHLDHAKAIFPAPNQPAAEPQDNSQPRA
jgi:hypothetical protein